MDLSLDITNSTVDPSASDNFAEGFYLFNEWYNSTNKTLWKCVDDGVWVDITNAGGGLTPEEERILKGSITAFNSIGVTINDSNSPLTVPMTNLTGINYLGYNIVTGSITIPVSGWYLVSAGLTGIGDNRRNNHKINMTRNGIAIQGLEGNGYSRNNGSPNFSASITPRFSTFPFAQGDAIDLVITFDGDNQADMSTIPQGVWITLEYKGN